MKRKIPKKKKIIEEKDYNSSYEKKILKTMVNFISWEHNYETKQYILTYKD